MERMLDGISRLAKGNKPTLNGERFLGNNEVAKLLNVSIRTLQDWRDNSIIPYIRHYKIFCVNVKYGIQYGFRIFYLIALQNEENYEREESCSA